MFDQNIKEKISSLFSDLSVMESVNSSEGWAELSESVAELTEYFTSQAEFSLADASSRAQELLSRLTTNSINNLQEAFAHIRELVSFLNDAAMDKNYDPEQLRCAVATADAYLEDLESADSSSSNNMPEIDEEFMAELEGRIDRLEKTLFDTPDNESRLDEVKSIFREYHTLKGEAGILGLTVLNEYWHNIEEPIEEARHGNLTLSRDIIDCLIDLTKFGRNLLRNGKLQQNELDSVATLLQNLQVYTGKSSAKPSSASAVAEVKVFSDIDEIADDDDDDFFAPTSSESSTSAAADDDDNFFAQQSTDSADDSNITEEDNDASVIAPPLPEQSENTESSSSEPDAQTQSQAVAAPAEPDQANEQKVERTSLKLVQIEVSRLDRLLDLVGEVALTGSHLANNPSISSQDNITTELLDLQRLCRSLHDLAANLRMTAVSPLFQRVQRAAIEASRAVNKRIEFTTVGADTHVDRIVIDKLSAALVHMARNSVDHGIESQEERRELGKPVQGQLKLAARRSGADVIIEFHDDGRGLDLDKILEKARNNGVIGPDEIPSEQETLKLIFSHGFSTAKAVTGLSGRGVGMSVVHESVESLRGNLKIINHPGQGLCIRISFPVALAAVETLLVKLGDNNLALPVQSVRETFRVTPKMLSSVSSKGTMINIRGLLVPVIDLSEQLGLPSDITEITDGVVILVQESQRLAAVLVDEVIETRQVVIRQLEGALQDIPAVTGAALLGDRKVALVLDIRRLMDKIHATSGESFTDVSAKAASADRQVETVSVGSNSVGIIDFSINTRNAEGNIVTHTFAINAFKTREFVPITPLTPVPEVPDGFEGVLTLREQTIPVMALDTLLGFNRGKTEQNREFDQIIIICEFSGVTVGFLVTKVSSVSYVTWSDIKPPPETGVLGSLNYVIGTIELQCIREDVPDDCKHDVAFMLDFERIVQQVIDLYGDIGADLGEVQLRKEHNRIMLVEDSPLIRRETAGVLRKAGIEVIEACDGKEALNIINQLYETSRNEHKSIFHYLDLVLSDIEMPQLDGYSLAMHIKNHPDLRLLPVLLHSSLTNETIVQRAKEVNADGFIPKCDPVKLSEHLRKYL